MQLPQFVGPIELLLSLIEEQRLEITAISLAAVADQYLEHIWLLGERDPAELAAFLEIAARLLLIKSRALLPQARPEERDEDDGTQSLIDRLREYRRFRQASQWLGERLHDSLSCYGREPALPQTKVALRGRADAADLVVAMRRLQTQADALGEPPPGPRPGVSLGSKLRLILRRLLRSTGVTFAALLDGTTTVAEVVVTFLALLELVHRGRAKAAQPGLFGQIDIVRVAREMPSRTSPHVEQRRQV